MERFRNMTREQFKNIYCSFPFRQKVLYWLLAFFGLYENLLRSRKKITLVSLFLLFLMSITTSWICWGKFGVIATIVGWLFFLPAAIQIIDPRQIPTFLRRHLEKKLSLRIVH